MLDSRRNGVAEQGRQHDFLPSLGVSTIRMYWGCNWYLCPVDACTSSVFRQGLQKKNTLNWHLTRISIQLCVIIHFVTFKVVKRMHKNLVCLPSSTSFENFRLGPQCASTARSEDQDIVSMYLFSQRGRHLPQPNTHQGPKWTQCASSCHPKASFWKWLRVSQTAHKLFRHHRQRFYKVFVLW